LRLCSGWHQTRIERNEIGEQSAAHVFSKPRAVLKNGERQRYLLSMYEVIYEQFD
jgi:hypothetical protein